VLPVVGSNRGFRPSKRRSRPLPEERKGGGDTKPHVSHLPQQQQKVNIVLLPGRPLYRPQRERRSGSEKHRQASEMIQGNLYFRRKKSNHPRVCREGEKGKEEGKRKKAALKPSFEDQQHRVDQIEKKKNFARISLSSRERVRWIIYPRFSAKKERGKGREEKRSPGVQKIEVEHSPPASKKKKAAFNSISPFAGGGRASIICTKKRKKEEKGEETAVGLGLVPSV